MYCKQVLYMQNICMHMYTCLTEVCGRCCDVDRKKSAPEGSNDEGDGGYCIQRNTFSNTEKNNINILVIYLSYHIKKILLFHLTSVSHVNIFLYLFHDLRDYNCYWQIFIFYFGNG